MLEVLRTLANTKRKFPVCLNNLGGAFKYLMNMGQNSKSSVVTVISTEGPTDRQLEIIDLQCNSHIREKVASVGVVYASMFFQTHLY